MLTQDDSVVPNMSLKGNLQRSSWKAEAIRRGDLKISGPIPLTEDMPLNEEEEKEFEEHHGALSSSPPQDTPLNHTHHPPDPPRAPPVMHQEPPDQNFAQTESPPPMPENQPHIREEQRQSPPKHVPVRTQTTPEEQRGSLVEPASYSTPSPLPPTPETPTRLSTKKKRKSGLRNVFRKMFGRRSRDEPHEDELQTVQRAQTQRQSQSQRNTVITRPSSERHPPVRRPRISDLDVEDVEPINPLGQHLPFPMNVNAPQEISPPHDYLMFKDRAPDFSRRRATLPNVHAMSETQSLNGRHKQLETWEERQEGDTIPSPQIGIALSSPSHARQSAHSIQSKRRSRSAGNLRELIKGRPSGERRRSAEIRYWRSSYASGSVHSTNTPRPRTAQTVETVRSIETRDTTQQPEVPMAELISAHHPPPITQPDQDMSQIQLPVEAFNFGDLKSDFSDDEDSEEPVAPPAPLERRVSIGERVMHLEEKMRTLETSVRRMSGHSNRQTIILENAPKGRRSRNRSSSASSQRQGSHHSSKGSNNTLHFRQYEDELPASEALQTQPLSAVNEFPASTSMHTGDTSTAPSDIPSQLTTLHNSLQRERHARKLLEAQVSALQRDLADLHSLVQRLISTTSPSYPTPSPDAIVVPNESRTPRASEVVNADKDKGDREAYERSASRTSSRVSPEDWATPAEVGFGSGFFSGKGVRL